MPSKLVPMKDRRPPTNGETIASLALGAPSLSIAVVLLASLFGSPVLDLTRQATIVTEYKIIGYEDVEQDGFLYKVPIKGDQAETTAPAWWYAPGLGYFLFAMTGVALAMTGVALRGKRKAIVSGAALAANLILLVVGYFLLAINANA
jgi:hypothetical protein